MVPPTLTFTSATFSARCLSKTAQAHGFAEASAGTASERRVGERWVSSRARAARAARAAKEQRRFAEASGSDKTTKQKVMRGKPILRRQRRGGCMETAQIERPDEPTPSSFVKNPTTTRHSTSVPPRSFRLLSVPTLYDPTFAQTRCSLLRLKVRFVFGSNGRPSYRQSGLGCVLRWRYCIPGSWLQTVVADGVIVAEMSSGLSV